VEVAGIEPASENIERKASTSLDGSKISSALILPTEKNRLRLLSLVGRVTNYRPLHIDVCFHPTASINGKVG
jgi:hypothetical protein